MNTLHRTPKMLARAVLRRMAQPISSMACALAGAICSVSTAAPAVALTFDDGPNREVTPKVLRILRRHDARAQPEADGHCQQPQPGRRLAPRGAPGRRQGRAPAATSPPTVSTRSRVQTRW